MCERSLPAAGAGSHAFFFIGTHNKDAVSGLVQIVESIAGENRKHPAMRRVMDALF